MDYLLPNQIFEVAPENRATDLAGLYRVLWRDTSADLVVVMCLRKPLRRPVTVKLSLLLPLFPEELSLTSIQPRPFSVIQEDEIPPSYRNQRDTAWEIIKPLVHDSNVPAIYERELGGRLIANHSRNLGVGPTQIYRYLYKYWAGGLRKNALLPDYDLCGPQGSLADRRQRPGTKKRGRRPDRVTLDGKEEAIGLVAADVRSRIIVGIHRFLKKGVPRSKAWIDTKRELFNGGFVQSGTVNVPILPDDHQAPTYRQFCRVVDELNVDLSLTKSIVDTSTWGTRYRGSLGSSRQRVHGPAYRFEIDATVVDVYLVSVFNRAWIIGRPVLYVIVDVFSAMVVGFYLGLEGPSWEGARAALFNAFTDKVEFCRQFGVEITADQWPCHHLPHKLLGDNAEMLSRASDELPRTLRIVMQNAPVRRGDWKPNVEQQFRLIQDSTVHFEPGGINKRRDDVARRRYVLDACLNIPELTGILIRHFIKYNRSCVKSDRLPQEMICQNILDATPLSLWTWGMENLTGGGIVEDKHSVWTSLLPRGIASIRHDGIHFNGRHYSSDQAIREEWFAKARGSSLTRKIEVRHIPYAPKQIWLLDRETRSWEPCDLLPRDIQFADARLEEIYDRLKVLKSESTKVESRTRQSNAALDSESETVVKNAKAEADAARCGLSKTKSMANIRENRQFEQHAMRAESLRKDAESVSQSRPEPPKGNVVPLRSPTPKADPLDDIWET